jgi:hypothetical protein
MSLPLLLLPLPLLLLLSSCSFSLFDNYQQAPENANVIAQSWFAADTGHFLFSTKIDILKNHFSGLMVVKPVNKDHYRVIFLTEVGLKIFDMEFFPDKEFMVHYMIEAMNRKPVVKTLGNDMSLILMNRLSGIKPVYLHKKGYSDRVFKYKNQGRKNYYFTKDSLNNPYLAKQTAGITHKVKADFFGTPITGIDSVRISHDNIRLSIELYRIHEGKGYAAE